MRALPIHVKPKAMEGTMRPSRGCVLFAIFASLFLLTSLPARSADHRDAPTIDDYSAIDINDVFMFRSPTARSRLVIALSTQAVAARQFGSSYHFQPNALYQLNFTTRKDAQPTATIEFVFGPFGNSSCPSPAPPCQAYEAKFPGGITISGFATQGTSGSVHLTPDINVAATKVGPIQVFAGPQEGPTSFDLIG